MDIIYQTQNGFTNVLHLNILLQIVYFWHSFFCEDGINIMWKSEVKNNCERLTPPPVQNKHLLNKGEMESKKHLVYDHKLPVLTSEAAFSFNYRSLCVSFPGCQSQSQSMAPSQFTDVVPKVRTLVKKFGVSNIFVVSQYCHILPQKIVSQFHRSLNS